MKFLIAILFFPLLAFGQLNIKAFGARESYADNSKYIQRAIDSAVKSGKNVIIPIGNFRVAKPLVVYNWTGESYGQSFIKIIGETTFWDRGNRSVLTATFGDAPLLSIQKGKGCLVDGITFVGKWRAPGSPYNTDLDQYRDTGTRDSRYSPYCAIAIDPFCYGLPIDGGYPPLKSFYRGDQSRGGSTGIIIRNCVFNGFTIGAITSPNGYTQNAELITFENIQITNCKIGFAGCQAQEKMNRIINVGAWGITHTLFVFNRYGEATPGHWIIDGVNVAGEVNQIIYRGSHEYFPLMMSNVYAESVSRIGFWQTAISDRMNNCVVDFKPPVEMNGFPVNHLEGGGVTISNSTIRNYGNKDLPIVLVGAIVDLNNKFEGRKTVVLPYKIPDGVKYIWGGPLTISAGHCSVPGSGKIGDIIFFMDYYNFNYKGIGIVESIAGGMLNIGNISPNIKSELLNVGISFDNL